MAGVARPPRIVFSRWRLRGSCREVWIRCFHSIGWCVALQRCYNNRFLHGGGYSGAVHRRKTAQATTWLVGMAMEAARTSGATR